MFMSLISIKLLVARCHRSLASKMKIYWLFLLFFTLIAAAPPSRPAGASGAGTSQTSGPFESSKQGRPIQHPGGFEVGDVVSAKSMHVEEWNSIKQVRIVYCHHFHDMQT